MSALKLVPPAAPEREVVELRAELERLEQALEHFSEALAESEVAREIAEEDCGDASRALEEAELVLGEYRILYARAQALRGDLEQRLLAVEGERDQARAERDEALLERDREGMTSGIRARLLADIVEAPVWRRGAPVARAQRVARLLG